MEHARTPHHVVIRIAAAAGADPRTVRRVLNGEDVRGLVRERIDKALKDAGLARATTEGGKAA